MIGSDLVILGTSGSSSFLHSLKAFHWISKFLPTFVHLMLAAVRSLPIMLCYLTRSLDTARHFCNLAPNMNAGVSIITAASAPGFGSATLGPGHHRFQLLQGMLSKSTRSATIMIPSVANCTFRMPI